MNQESNFQASGSSQDTVEVMIDRTRYTVKPPKGSPKYGKISNNLGINRASMTIPQLAQALTSGMSVCPGVMKDGGRKDVNWIQQQVFALDIENGYTFEAYKENAEKIGIIPAFVYPTLSHTAENHRYRVVYVCDYVVEDAEVARFIRRLLIQQFPNVKEAGVDENCKDLSRYFMGTNKPLLWANFEQRINPIQLYRLYEHRLRESDSSHYRRNITALAEKLQISTCQSTPGVVFFKFVDKMPQTELFGEIYASVYTYNTTAENSPQVPTSSLIPFQSIFYKVIWSDTAVSRSQKRSGKKNSKNKNPRHAKAELTNTAKLRISKPNQAVLVSQCQLLREFLSGVRHGHLARRILATNLVQISGGHKIYKSGIESRTDYPQDYLLQDVVQYDYKPEGCANCPYHKSCAHNRNLLQQIPLMRGECRVLESASEPVSIDASRKTVRDLLTTIMTTDHTGMYVIRCDTGVGKTEAALTQNLKNVCYSCPTHRLKSEIASRVAELGKKVWLWTEPPLLPHPFQGVIDSMNRTGLGGKVGFYQKIVNDPRIQADPSLVSEIEKYIQASTDVFVKKEILTTTEKGLQLQKNENLKNFLWDEDPIHNMIKIVEVPVRDVVNLLSPVSPLSKPCYAGLREYFEYLLKGEANAVIERNWTAPDIELVSRFVKEVSWQIDFPIMDLLRSTAFIRDQGDKPDDGRIHGVRFRPLREDRKHIVLSATANEFIYRRLFGKVEFHDLPPTELKGKLYCHTERSFSKHGVRNSRSGFANDVAQSFDKYKFDGIITHKTSVADPANAMYLKNSKPKIPVYATFGAVQGLDSFAGKNVAVYGSPFPPEQAVRLWAFVLQLPGYNDKFEWEERVVQWLGYEFMVMTPSANPEIQQLYLWLTQSELLQAVGRARLVSNDCTVHVFSKFPLPGCILSES